MDHARVRAAYSWSSAPQRPALRVPAQRRPGSTGPVDPSVTLDRTVLMVHLSADGLAGRGLDPVDVAERLAGVVLRSDAESCTVLVAATAAGAALLTRRVQELDPLEVVVVEAGDRVQLAGRAPRPAPVVDDPVVHEGVVVETRPATVLPLRRSGWSYL